MDLPSSSGKKGARHRAVPDLWTTGSKIYNIPFKKYMLRILVGYIPLEYIILRGIVNASTTLD
jgi:hypothetical protein